MQNRHILSILATVSLNTLVAQVPITNVDERNWLNEQIPGIVDGAGVMDTLHPAIAGLQSSSLVIYDLNGTIELRSLGYLNALASLTIWTYPHNVSASASVAIDRVAPSLRYLDISLRNAMGVSLQLPALPQEMDHLSLTSVETLGQVHIELLPEELGLLRLSNWDDLAWAGPCTAEEPYMGYTVETAVDLVLPPLIAEEATVHDMVIDQLDLSAVSVPNLSFTSAC